MTDISIQDELDDGNFEYRRLTLGDDIIRLVRVLRERSSQGYIRLRMTHTGYRSRYNCVSYQWGSLSYQHDILVNDRRFRVSSNLYAFLEEMYAWAQNGFDQPLWIDAICIDQGCSAERSHQVQRMGLIYSAAQEVFVWLGDHEKLVIALFDWISLSHLHQCPAHLRQQWGNIRFNTYWQRAWIKQEILLAKRVTVVFQGAVVEWTLLGQAIARSGDLNRLEHEYAAYLWTYWDERWTSKWNRTRKGDSSDEGMVSFWSLMHTHQTASCADPRDRVYSLLGLIEEDQGFKVDYDESITDLFWRVSEHFNVGDSPELVDILTAALLQDTSGDQLSRTETVNPWALAQSIRHNPDIRVRIPIRRVTSPNSVVRCVRGSVRCRYRGCEMAPRLCFARKDILLCANAYSDEPTRHGCVHAVAHPLDEPAAEPFEVRLLAHHHKRRATATLQSTAIQTFDIGTERWVGISTWSTLESALGKADLDRTDRLKLSIPAAYALMIWFGVNPNQLDDKDFVCDTGLPSVHHALPKGTRITRIALNYLELDDSFVLIHC